jgi:hypothetical protein
MENPLFLLTKGYCFPSEAELEVLKSSGCPWLKASNLGRDTKRVVVHRTKSGIALGHPWECDVFYMKEIPFSDVTEIIAKYKDIKS